MTNLSVYQGDDAVLLGSTNEYQDIVGKLAEIDVQLERWHVTVPLEENASAEVVLNSYQQEIEKINQRYGFQAVDVVSLYPDHPQKQELRQKFLLEHTHSDFEIRFFVSGKALFYLHVGNLVYLVLCEAGDLISVPAETTHWFDMGESPNFKSIRFFTTTEGWIADFTGSSISQRFPTFEEYVGSLK
ncbi:acireductone dioxygenase [Gloeocapsa sp. PCC 73106]|uniref:1,2-dihydroxy-3-keto-5-methylthiopentene dioxygenase n=1 Tax=Gloeocapsa sp. PCC 73106 TaxID=102232 RepID=UPI0002ACF2C9|nr:hypothetical protein [Gloeocapsa sp. PCC 73106]ELR99658.1 hypothetical protein GLO73106DRAFT_00035100 [Gloeocapsa sp. PCC 73106]